MIWFVLKSILNRKLRSFLSSLGIAIGTFAILCMLSIGKGSLKGIEESIKEMGADKIIVFPNTYFKEEDVKVIEKIEGVEDVLPIKVYSTGFGPWGVYIYGIELKKTKSFFKGTGYEIEKGRWIKRKNECVLGAKIAEKLEKDVGDYIKIGDKKYRVVGVLKMTGSRFDDFSIIVSEEGFSFKVEGYRIIFVKVRGDVEEVAKEIEEKLEKKRGVKDFEVFTQRTILERLKQISNMFTAFFLSSALISLIVGSIGVMNSIFTSVHERIKIIGLLRAVGATKNQIMTLFLLESILICLFGFILGSIAGTVFVLVTEKAIREFLPNYKAVLSIENYLICFAVSITFGVISGIFPARKAASIEPAEALRYE